MSAYRLAVKAGDDRAPGLLSAMLRTVPHLLQLQYTPDNSYFLAQPELAVGGMRGGHGRRRDSHRLRAAPHQRDARAGVAAGAVGAGLAPPEALRCGRAMR